MPCKKDRHDGLDGKAAEQPPENRERQSGWQRKRDAERNGHDEQKKNGERKPGESRWQAVRQNFQRRIGKGCLHGKDIEQQTAEDKETEHIETQHRKILQMAGNP